MTNQALDVLLVEDNIADAALLTHELTQSSFGPFSIVHVSRLSDAINRVTSNRFDAVILDLGLPDSQGLGTLEQLRRSVPREIPIVVVTGSEDEAAQVKAIRKGAEDYLVKGASAGEMRARAIRAAIERKRTDEACRASEQQLALAVEAANLGIFDWDLATNQITCSCRHAELFGIPEGQVKTTVAAFEHCVHPADWLGLQSAIRQSAADHEEFVHEYRVIWPDGSEHWLESRGKAMEDDWGIPIRLIGTVMDVSERKAAAEKAMVRIEQSAHLTQANITPRELMVLKLMAKGLPSKRIALEMKISINTVHKHRASLMAKTKALNVADLTRMVTVAGDFSAHSCRPR